MKDIKILLIVFLGILTVSSCTKEAALNPESSNKRCVINELSKDQITNLLYSNDFDDVQFIDIRNARDFSVSHLPNAINLPSKTFFKKERFKQLPKDKVLIVYGYDSSTPRLITLLSAHFKKANLYVAKGGYDYLKSKIMDNFGAYSGVYDDETPLCDYSKKMSYIASRAGSASSDNKPAAKAAPRPMVKRKKKEVSGGCG